MKAYLIAVLCGWASSSAAQTPPAVSTTSVAVSSASLPAIDVVWPKEGFKYPPLKRTFTFGSVTPRSTFTVNGQTVAVRSNGAFITMVNLGTGTFQLSYSAVFGSASSTVVRAVSVDVPYGANPRDYEAIKSLEPSTTVEARAGDVVAVRCMGPPGRQGTFSIKHLESDLPLAEKDGLYEGHYRIGPRDKGKELKIAFKLWSRKERTLKAEAAGRLTVLDASQYRVAVTTAPLVVIKSATGGYTFFLPAGIPLAVTGKSGPLLHVELSDHEDGLVDADRVRLLPEGTPPPSGSVGKNISTTVGKESVKVYIQVERKLPFEVRYSVEPLAFEVRFYGGIHRVDRINYASDDPVVREVLWRQESIRTAVFRVTTRLTTGWGYDAYYEGDKLVLEIRRPPLLPANKSVFPGRRIVVDPGHGPEPSAIGPLETTERDVVLDIGMKLKALLEKEGASTYMIRTSSMGPLLADRPGLAWKNKGDLYVSIHANALPANADPYEAPRGYMIFYYYPQSRALAEAMHAVYRKRFPELADEGLRWGDLHVCRVPQMPSILVESAYVILPEQEDLLRNPKSQDRFAKALFEGIKDFYEAYRKVQLAKPDERRAARE